MYKISKIFFTLSIFSTLLTSSAAQAVTFQGATVYRSVTIQGKDIVIISDPAQGEKAVQFLGRPRTRQLRANDCGVIKVPDKNKTIGRIKVGVQEINLNNLPIHVLPKCRIRGTDRPPKETVINIPYPEFKTPSGDLIFQGNDPADLITIEIQRKNERKIPINSCDFGVFTSPFDGDFPEKFTISGTEYIYSNLPIAESPPRCLKTNGVHIKYTPPGY
jgi:hypothetical protein